MTTDLPALFDVGYVLALPGFECSAVGARPTDLDAIDPAATLAACAQLRPVGDVSRWLLGDFAAGLMATVGEAEAIRRLAVQGHNQAEFEKAVKLALAVPHGVRRPGLTWSHHEEVHRLDPPLQAFWLEVAETEGLSVRELRAAIKADLEADQPALEGTERLPHPPETLLRRALADAGPDTPVLWLPSAGGLSAARVVDTARHGERAVVVVEIDAALLEQLPVTEAGEAA
ncbi:MAG TPA: hypothetical protein VHK88_20090 [Aquihabitans sp.]|jgi:hypothetical protein|nr:hypothetical protein [Aquihabitans sp.]